MQGSGKSFKSYFIDNRHKSNIHLLFFNTGSGLVKHKNIKSLFHDKKISDNIEMLNLVSFGSVYGMSYSLIPCFSELEYPHYLVQPIIEYMKHLMVYVNKFYKNTNIDGDKMADEISEYVGVSSEECKQLYLKSVIKKVSNVVEASKTVYETISNKIDKFTSNNEDIKIEQIEITQTQCLE
jgi:hypothetical protein